MKNLIFILFSCFIFGQDVSPYYPAKQDNAYRGGEPSQLTYYDTSFIQGLLPNFLRNNLGMTQISTDMDVKTKTIRQTYQDSFSTGKLTFTITTDVIDSNVTNPEIVTSVKITGTPSRVLDFFVRYWDSTIDFESIKADVERKHFQDIAKLYFNKGKPYILVVNNAYKNTKEFEIFFNKLLSDNANLHK